MHLKGENKNLSKQFYEDSSSRSNAFVAVVKSKPNVRVAKKRDKNKMALERIIFLYQVFGPIGSSSTHTPRFWYSTYVLIGLNRHRLHVAKLRANLQFMAACNDQTISKHVIKVESNFTYISPRIQNDLLDAMSVSLEKMLSHW